MPSTRSTVALSPNSSSWELFAKGVSDIRSLVSCRICTRLMYEPYTTRCGHTFCYGCLSKWLNHGERKRQCPDCRARVKDEPSPDYTIRNIVHVLLSDSAFLDDGETSEILQVEQSQEAKALERDRETQNGQGLFQGLFKNRYNDAIHDQSDGVMRCPSCHWEVEGYYCDRCELDFDDDSLADFSDYSYSSGLDLHGSEEADVSDEPNEDDEAFIDDGRDHEQHTSSRFLFNEDTVPPWLLPDDDIAEDMYDGPGTYSGPYQLESDSDEAIEHGIQRMNSLMAGSEHTISGSSGSGLSESEGSDSEDSSDANTSDGDNTDSSDEADEEPVQQHTRARPRAQATTNTRTESQRDNSRSRRSSVVDLTALDGPSTPQRRARRGTSTNDDNDSNQSATSTIRAGRRQNGTASSNEEEPETPIPIRPRKRERIVLSDSEDDDTSATVQTRPQARRRRINRNNSMAQYPDDQHHRQRMPLTESTPRDSSGTLSTLPSRRDEPPVRSVFPPLHRNAARSNRNILMPTTRASS